MIAKKTHFAIDYVNNVKYCWLNANLERCCSNIEHSFTYVNFMMQSYNIPELKNKLSSADQMTVLFGAGDIGELAKYSFNKLGITVDSFCDNYKKRRGEKYLWE